MQNYLSNSPRTATGLWTGRGAEITAPPLALFFLGLDSYFSMISPPRRLSSAGFGPPALRVRGSPRTPDGEGGEVLLERRSSPRIVSAFAQAKLRWLTEHIQAEATADEKLSAQTLMERARDEKDHQEGLTIALKFIVDNVDARYQKAQVLKGLVANMLCKFRRKRGLLLFRFAREEAAREARQREVAESRARRRATRQAATRARLGGNGTPRHPTPIQFHKNLSRVA